MLQPRDGKNQLDSHTRNYMLNLLRKKFINKIKYSRSLSDPDFLGVTISSHVIYFQFLPFFRHLRTTLVNQNWSIRSKRISSNWDENFSKGKIFRADQKKSLLITCELMSATMFVPLFWWSQRFIFPLLYFTSVLILKQSQFSSIVWTVTSTDAFYHCWSYMKQSDLWIRFVVLDLILT